MTTEYETWAESFHFTDDLKALEALYHQQHQEAMAAQATGQPKRQKASPEPLPVSPEDAAFLSQLSGQLAGRLEQRLYAPEVLAQYLKLHEFRQDNILMAEQIQTLLDRVSVLESENQRLRHEAPDYHRLMGNLYLKLQA